MDYGLRQYVSAVEFKAGPESNPHAAQIQSRRASGTSLSTKTVSLSGEDKAVIVTLSPEDFAKFPDLGYDTPPPSAVGDLGYEVQYDDNGTIHKFQYHGHIKTLTGATITAVPKKQYCACLQYINRIYPK